ncbi:Gcd10p family-domain-containing protein [Coniochaeta sp. 2T2.1]|nr:Gcd10p family-domain-containing protein [Coniochaeta sp. 2T2.1]
MYSVVQPNGWVALKLPSDTTKVLQIVPNTTISLGKYGSFPSNLIIHRPYHLTYELEDKREGESFCRLRVVPADELYADVFAEESGTCSTPDDTDRIISATDGVEYSLVDPESGNVVARSNREIIDDNARQSLTQEEIEELKRDGTGAGKDIIAKLLLSHTALDQKTSFSLAKYKLLKTKKYIRRFQVLPLDVPLLGKWMLEEKDAMRVMDMRDEAVGLIGCWANVHFGGEDIFLEGPAGADADAAVDDEEVDREMLRKLKEEVKPVTGRWLVIDDTSGFLVAAMAERMGILDLEEKDIGDGETAQSTAEVEEAKEVSTNTTTATKAEDGSESTPVATSETTQRQTVHREPRSHDFQVPFSQTNTITLLHAANQPNLSFLTYYGFDIQNPNHPPHPLVNHLLTLTWLQLLHPDTDAAYSTNPPSASSAQLASMKPNRRGTYHRKRRRFARTRHIVDNARAGNYSGLAVASTMDNISILQHTLPLLAGGAPIAIYSPTPEPLVELADCFSVARRSAWMNPETAPVEAVGKTAAELERWEGNDDFPLNPTLVLGANIQTSRARRWQVLPGRTHPTMTDRGGAEGYVLTGWRARPAEGRVEARGKHTGKRRKVEEKGASESATGTPASDGMQLA